MFNLTNCKINPLNIYELYKYEVHSKQKQQFCIINFHCYSLNTSELALWQKLAAALPF